MIPPLYGLNAGGDCILFGVGGGNVMISLKNRGSVEA
jgi:hypothetical protein